MQPLEQSSDTSNYSGVIPSLQSVGGTYESLNLTGIVEATSDLHVKYLLTVNGNLNGRALTANGLNALGSITLTEIRVNFLTLKGTLIAMHLSDGQHVNLDGSTQVIDLKAVSLSLTGSLRSRAICVERSIKASGKIEANLVVTNNLAMYGTMRTGTLEIDTAHLVLDKKEASAINRLIGKSIYVIAKENNARLESSYIEGRTINLQATKAKLVCGENVTIGYGCEIEEVRYSDILTIQPGSLARIQTKI